MKQETLSRGCGYLHVAVEKSNKRTIRSKIKVKNQYNLNNLMMGGEEGEQHRIVSPEVSLTRVQDK